MHARAHARTHTLPGVVVALVVAKSVTERGSGLVEVLVGHVLMARQRVGVGEGGVDLDSPVEKLDLFLGSLGPKSAGLADQGQSD